MVAIKFYCRPPLPDPWDWISIGQNSTFSEHGNVPYQIKENHKGSYIFANALPQTSPDPGDGGQ